LNKRSARASYPLKAFLSHRYESPRVNLHFFGILSEAAKVHFSVDRGTLATNVTRLERLVREADAFIGIYPLSLDPGEAFSVDELRKESRYFRLELDLAIRAQIPAIVFMDERYGHVLSAPPWIRQFKFDAQEVRGLQNPKDRVFAKGFKSFCDAALAFQSYRVNQADARGEGGKVGLLLPEADYPADARHRIRAVLERTGRDIVELPWPPILSRQFYAAIGEIDWMIVDVGDNSASAGIVGFLHGFFIPSIRLVKMRSESQRWGEVGASLFGNLDAGFPKDVIQWKDVDGLESAIAARIKTILLPPDLIDTVEKAISYFESAALRKEVVFVSYAGKDIGTAQPVIASLRKVFKTVFDYKDGESIVPGKPWIEEIFQTLSRAAVAVPLLSKSYVESGNCLHEAQEIVARRDDGKVVMLPIKLYDEPLELPVWLRSIQYTKLGEIEPPADVPSMIIKLLQPKV
jgi:hypothetical protein